MIQNPSHPLNRIIGLDLLRTVAILLVFVWHYRGKMPFEWLTWIHTYGWTGVDLFFVLSGYLISSQLFKSLKGGYGLSLKTFYLKRTLRILPAYWVVVALYFLLPAWNDGHGLPPLWKFLTFTQNFGLDRSTTSGFSHAWSLCVEEHFYLTLPLLVLGIHAFKSRLSPKFFAIGLPLLVFIGGFLLRGTLWLIYISPALKNPNFKRFGSFYNEIIYYPTYNRLDGILMGVVIALLLTFSARFRKFLEQFPNLPFAVGLVFLGVGCWLTSDRTSFSAAVFGFPVFALGYGGLVLSAAIPHSILNWIKIPGITLMATLSYTFYLIHKALIHLSQSRLKDFAIFENEIAMIMAAFLISVVGALILHLTVERPFLNLRDRIFARSKNCR